MQNGFAEKIQCTINLFKRLGGLWVFVPMTVAPGERLQQINSNKKPPVPTRRKAFYREP